MNIGNVEKLIHFLEAENNQMKFQMDVWIEIDGEQVENIPNNFCGTVGCIAGAAAVLAVQEGASPHQTVKRAAQIWLGLDPYSAIDLFLGGWRDKPLADITVGEVIAYLKSFLPAPTSLP